MYSRSVLPVGVKGEGVLRGGGNDSQQGQRDLEMGHRKTPPFQEGVIFSKLCAIIIFRMHFLKLSIPAAFNTSGVLILIILLSEVLCCQDTERDL
jgi:hypothetical protein